MSAPSAAARLALLTTGLLLAGNVSALRSSTSAPPPTEPLPLPDTLSHAELIAAGIERNFEGDRSGADAVWSKLRARDPSHPAAPVMEVSTLYWRQMYDELDTQYDAAIEEKCQEAIRLARARLTEDPDDVEAHLYLGRALIQLGRLQGIRGRYLDAGRNGEEGRRHLERVLVLEPELIDARYPVGLYYYYAALVTRWFKWLQWLPFVPSGDAPTGLRYLEQVAHEGAIHRWDAQFILSNIRTYHEGELAEALQALRELHARFPDNTLIHFELIETLLMAQDHRAVIEEALVLEHHPGADHLDRGRREMARVWRARAELQRGRPERAWEILQSFGPDQPRRPHWGHAWVELVRARVLDVLGDREGAKARYERVRDLEAPFHSERARELALEGLRRPFAVRRPAMRATPED